MAYSDEDALWRDAFAGEATAQKVRRIAKVTGLNVQDVATRLGLNRLHPTQEKVTRERPSDFWKKAQAEYDARRERVNGKAGKGHPKVDRAKVFQLRSEGWGVRAIARELGCSHVAVMKILKAGGNQ